MNTTKTFIVGMLALVLAVIASTCVTAYDPYDGVNRMGTYYQYTNTVQYDYQTAYGQGNYYDYISPPRAGGWFGSTSGWLVGLRSPMYTDVPPTHYTNYNTPVQSHTAYYGGGQGYPRARASDFPAYRGRAGGVFSY